MKNSSSAYDVAILIRAKGLNYKCWWNSRVLGSVPVRIVKIYISKEGMGVEITPTFQAVDVRIVDSSCSQ